MQKSDEIDITDFNQLEGVGPATSKALKNVGKYSTILEVAGSLVNELAERCDIKPTAAQEIIQAANDFLTEKGFLNSIMRNGLEDLQRRESVFKISTGASVLDELLNGGIESKAITEFYAKNGIGKTQVCFCTAIQCTLPLEQGGLDGNVLYIDTEGAYRPNRIREICAARGYDANRVLSKITIVSANYKASLMYIVDHLPKTVEEKKIKLIIIDSIIALFRAEYGGRGELAPRMQQIGSIMHKLSRITDVHDVAVLITNQMQDNVDGFSKVKAIPCGGNTLGHASTYRIEIKKGEKGLRKAFVAKSPQSGNESVEFKITPMGIENAEKKKKSKIDEELEQEDIDDESEE